MMFGGGAMLEHSRIMDPSNMQENSEVEGGSRPPPPAPPKKPAAPQLSFEEQIAMASQNLKKRNEQEGEEARPPPKAPPKAAPLSFAEQIALASAGLKKKDPNQQEETKGPPKAPPSKTPGKEGGPEPPQKRMSNMDALKQQILLRKQSMNPTLASKKDEEPGAGGGSLAKMAMAQSKFADDSFDDVSEKSSEDSD
jgi:hypothetical protein